MKGKYGVIFFTASILSILYGVAAVRESHHNQILSSASSEHFYEALKIDTAQSREVLAVAERLIASNEQPLSPELLRHLVQASYSDHSVAVETLVNFEFLTAQVEKSHAASADGVYTADLF